MPWWTGVLEAAEAWGCPPWEIAPPDNKFLWYARWSSYTDAINKATREKQSADMKRAKSKRR